VWSNRAGNHRCSPAAIARPFGTDELAAVVAGAARAGQRVKVAGRGHALTDAACTDGTLVLLDRHRRTLALDRDRARVTVQAGMTLVELDVMLWRYGLALPDPGGVGTQTIGGALATAAHGSGRHRCVAAQALAIELVTGTGEVVELTPEKDAAMFSAAQVSVGALGAVSTVTLQCAPGSNLRAGAAPMRVDEALERFDELAGGNAHFAFRCAPHSRWAVVTRANLVDGPTRERSRTRSWADDVLVPGSLSDARCRLQARFPRAVPWLDAHLPAPPAVEYVDRSDRVLVAAHPVWSEEMEYGFPRAHARHVFEEVRRFARTRDVGAACLIEVRVSQADDIPLSMASGRETCFITVHACRGQEFERYFRGVEAIMGEVGGRPHWGKAHSQDAASLRGLYPGWQRFQDARDRLDPGRVFANAYTERVLG
jgi:FAD-linked oxidoreductase